MEKNENSDEVILLRDNNNDYSKRKYIILIIIGIGLGFSISQLYKFRWNLIESNYDYMENKNLVQLNNDILNNNDIMNNMNFDKDMHDTDDMTVANRLRNEVNVLCWIMTQPINHKTKAQYISKTWGTRCNKLLILSTTDNNDTELLIIGLKNVQEGTTYLWHKTKESLKFIYKHFINYFDWFLRADDDTYVIVENLRYMLHGYDPRTPIIFGHKYDNEDYMFSGAGYVLSREALKRFIENALPDEKKCSKKSTGIPDVELGKCLKNVGVIAGNSLDSKNRSRFHGRRPSDFIPGKIEPNFGYWSYMYYETFTNKHCCSDYPISFHNIKGKQMFLMDYFIYHLRPYGIERKSEPLTTKKIYIEKKIPLN